MIRQSGFVGSTISMFYIKVIIFGILPLALSIFAAIIWYIAYKVQEIRTSLPSKMNLKQNIRVTAFVMTYMTYPIITN